MFRWDSAVGPHGGGGLVWVEGPRGHIWWEEVERKSGEVPGPRTLQVSSTHFCMGARATMPGDRRASRSGEARTHSSDPDTSGEDGLGEV